MWLKFSVMIQPIRHIWKAFLGIGKTMVASNPTKKFRSGISQNYKKKSRISKTNSGIFRYFEILLKMVKLQGKTLIRKFLTYWYTRVLGQSIWVPEKPGRRLLGSFRCSWRWCQRCKVRQRRGWSCLTRIRRRWKQYTCTRLCHHNWASRGREYLRWRSGKRSPWSTGSWGRGVPARCTRVQIPRAAHRSRPIRRQRFRYLKNVMILRQL